MPKITRTYDIELFKSLNTCAFRNLASVQFLAYTMSVRRYRYTIKSHSKYTITDLTSCRKLAGYVVYILLDVRSLNLQRFEWMAHTHDRSESARVLALTHLPDSERRLSSSYSEGSTITSQQRSQLHCWFCPPDHIFDAFVSYVENERVYHVRVVCSTKYVVSCLTPRKITQHTWEMKPWLRSNDS